jgi:hypothetical protein
MGIPDNAPMLEPLDEHAASTRHFRRAPTRGHLPEVAPRSHGHAKRDHARLLATAANPHDYAEFRMDRPPPHVHGKEGVDGSSPSEGFTKGQQWTFLFVPSGEVLVDLSRRSVPTAAVRPSLGLNKTLRRMLSISASPAIPLRRRRLSCGERELGRAAEKRRQPLDLVGERLPHLRRERVERLDLDPDRVAAALVRPDSRSPPVHE